ncbi:MAG TPA: CopD family protein, partial [Ktedonobacterales bacterium]|nr:CopD family protein [Ktedonobacterales bacterium]
MFVVTWFAGLFYLPRLFVYHATTTDAAGLKRFVVMERRLFFLMSLGALLAVLFGLIMIVA